RPFEQIPRPPGVHREQGVEDRSDEVLALLMRFAPLLCASVRDPVERRAKHTPDQERIAELAAELEQGVDALALRQDQRDSSIRLDVRRRGQLPEASTCTDDSVEERVLEVEVLQESDEIRESLVERQGIEAHLCAHGVGED